MDPSSCSIILRKQKDIKGMINVLLNAVKLQSSLLDPYFGQALIKTAKTEGSGEIAKLLFAAGARDNPYFDDAWAKACEEQNTSFMNAFFEDLTRDLPTEGS